MLIFRLIAILRIKTRAGFSKKDIQFIKLNSLFVSHFFIKLISPEIVRSLVTAPIARIERHVGAHLVFWDGFLRKEIQDSD